MKSRSNSIERMFVIVVFVASFVVDGHGATLSQRVQSLEWNMVNVRGLINQWNSKVSRLETLSLAHAEKLNSLSSSTAELDQLADLTASNAELRQQNAELQSMLATFERFFGSLLVESPESFDPSRSALERMDSLNAFLGNSEALLAGLRPDPVTVPTNDTVDPEELGRVLADLTEVNADLEQKVGKLEKRVDNTVGIAGDRSLTGGTDDIFTLDQCSQRLEYLEAQLNALTATELEQDSARRLSGSTNVISDRDRDILEGAVYGTNNRGVTSVRKSAFSVASTQPTVGLTTAQPIEFDYVYANKGNHWNSTSQEFVSNIQGYYYFYFSLRSYDGRYMGVTLMKNEEFVTAMFTEADGRNVMESQGVVLPLEIGDRVWLRLGPSTTFAVHSDKYKYCTFSGFLVYKGL